MLIQKQTGSIAVLTISTALLLLGCNGGSKPSASSNSSSTCKSSASGESQTQNQGQQQGIGQGQGQDPNANGQQQNTQANNQNNGANSGGANYSLTSDTAPTWSDISSMLKSKYPECDFSVDCTSHSEVSGDSTTIGKALAGLASTDDGVSYDDLKKFIAWENAGKPSDAATTGSTFNQGGIGTSANGGFGDQTNQSTFNSSDANGSEDCL